jgi:mRNA interferase RelE/StbE
MKTTYKITKTPLFEKQLKKLDHSVREKIAKYIRDVIGQLEDPKAIAKPLVGRFKGYHRFRVNDYRLICHILDREVTIVMLEVGHRREIYTIFSNEKLRRYAEEVEAKFETIIAEKNAEDREKLSH